MDEYQRGTYSRSLLTDLADQGIDPEGLVLGMQAMRNKLYSYRNTRLYDLARQLPPLLEFTTTPKGLSAYVYKNDSLYATLLTYGIDYEIDPGTTTDTYYITLDPASSKILKDIQIIRGTLTAFNKLANVITLVGRSDPNDL